MKKRLELQVEQSEKRERLNTILAMDANELTDELRGELASLTARLQEIEPELRAALVAEAAETETRNGSDSEGREFRALEQRANLGNYVAAVIEHRALDGAEAELNQHHNLAGNWVPLDLLRTEHRAVTPGPSNNAANEQPLIMPIFADGAAAFLGVDMPTVESGDAVFPVLTTRPTVHGPFEASEAAAETDGAFTASVLAPKRLQASFFYRRGDNIKFTQLDPGLRQALSSALSEAIDKEVIDTLVTDIGRDDADAKDTHTTYRQRLVYSEVDGRYATMDGDIRVLVGAATLANMAGAYRANNADDSALDSVRRVAGGVRVSPHIAAVAANKQDAIVRKGMRRDFVAPTWRGVEIINDPYTKASTGEIVLTAALYAAFETTRTDAFARVQTQHA